MIHNRLRKTRFYNASSGPPPTRDVGSLVLDTSALGYRHAGKLIDRIDDGLRIVTVKKVVDEHRRNRRIMEERRASAEGTESRRLIDALGTVILSMLEDRKSVYRLQDSPEKQILSELMPLLPKNQARHYAQRRIREIYDAFSDLVAWQQELGRCGDVSCLRGSQTNLAYALVRGTFDDVPRAVQDTRKGMAAVLENESMLYDRELSKGIRDISRRHDFYTKGFECERIRGKLKRAFERCAERIWLRTLGAVLEGTGPLSVLDRLDNFEPSTTDRDLVRLAYEIKHGKGDVLIYSADKDLKHLLYLRKLLRPQSTKRRR